MVRGVFWPRNGLGGRTVRVVGSGISVPEEVWSNQRLVERLARDGIETSDKWIRSHTGICERRIASKGETTSVLAAKAACAALRDAGIRPDELDLIVCATSTPDAYLPSTACLVQGSIGANNAVAFDINAACSGFVFALMAAAQFVETGRSSRALVIGADTYSRIVDWKDRSTCVFFGDGAGALLLDGPSRRPGVLGAYIASDGGGSGCIRAPACESRYADFESNVALNSPCPPGHFSMAGREVFEFAVKALPRAVRTLLEVLELPIDVVDMLISHQANINIIRMGLQELGISQNKAFINLDRYGNTCAASVPIAFHEARSDGYIKEGDHAMLVGFGGGLTWGSALIQV